MRKLRVHMTSLSAAAVLLVSGLLAAPAAPAAAQEAGRIETLAGGPGAGPGRLVGQDPVFVRVQGQSVLVADGAHQVLRRLDLTTGHASVVAGVGGEFLLTRPGRPPLVTPDDGGPASKAEFHRLGAFAYAPDGTIYLADERRIRRISPSGIVTTAVGTGARRVSAQADEVEVQDLPLGPVTGMAVDAQGRLWFAEDRIDASGGTIRRLDSDGVARLVIGYGSQFLQEAAGRQRLLHTPKGLFFDQDGTLVFLDVREFDSTVLRYRADRVQLGPGVDFPAGDLSGANNGDLLVAGGAQITRLRPDGSAVREPGTGQALLFGEYASVAMLPNGRPVIARNRDYLLTTIDDAGKESPLAGDGSAGAAGDGGPAAASQLGRPTSVSRMPDGSIVIADETAHRVRRVLPDGRMTTMVGTGDDTSTGDGGPASTAAIRAPSAVEAAPDGSVYVAARNENNAYVIRKISRSGTISTYAGGANEVEPVGDARQQFLGSHVQAMAAGADGSLYVNRGCQILRIAPGLTPDAGGVTTVYAGGVDYYSDDACGDSGDGETATSARFGTPNGLTMSPLGELYVSDSSARRVRRIDASGTVHAFAGRNYQDGVEPYFAGDGGPATEAHLYVPSGLAVRADGSVLIADQLNFRIRRVDPEGTISTLAGGRFEGPLGDGGAPTNASLNAPRDVEVGASGQVYIAEPGSPSMLYNYGHHRVRVVSGLAATPEASARPSSASSPAPGDESSGSSSPIPASSPTASGSPAATPPTPATTSPSEASPAAPSQAATPRPTTSETPPPGAAPSPTPTAGQRNDVPSLAVQPAVVRFAQPAYVTVVGTPGATVDLFARKFQREFVRIREGLVLDGRGRATIPTRPDVNLRFLAKDRAVPQGSSIGGTSGLVTVEKQVSLNVRRVGVNRFTFTGSINPMHSKAVVELRRHGRVIKAHIPVNSARVYSFTGTLPPGTAEYRISTPTTGYNAFSQSPIRSLRVF